MIKQHHSAKGGSRTPGCEFEVGMRRKREIPRNRESIRVGNSTRVKLGSSRNLRVSG